jgi:phosphoribosylaminoimidazole-succinocarboxamide synthase
MLVRRTHRIDVECVARGYLSGSAWSEYSRYGTAGGIPLPAGLAESQQLPEPIFTPAIKAKTGHDENISFERLAALVGRPLAERLREKTLAVYAYAASLARERGIIIADTKMEFGLLPGAEGESDGAPAGAPLRNEQDGTEGALILIDELLTPDSSRFWDAAAYGRGQGSGVGGQPAAGTLRAPSDRLPGMVARPHRARPRRLSPEPLAVGQYPLTPGGGSPPSYDKQFVRDYLEGSGWNKEPPAPELPADVVARTREKYVDALRRLTGQALG